MGNWTLIIQGTGVHHNFKSRDKGSLVPDGEGDYQRRCHDADYMAARFVRELKAQRQTVTAATFTSGGMDDINKDRHVLQASV